MRGSGVVIANDNEPRPRDRAGAAVEAWSGKDRATRISPSARCSSPRACAPHVHAYYAFARNADDIADSATLAPAEKIARLDVMEEVLTGRRDEGSPSAARLRAASRETGVAAIHAPRTAHRLPPRRDEERAMPTGPSCSITAATPPPRSAAMCWTCTARPQNTWPASDALCAALQVLNHLQDGAKDLRALDRCYIPQDCWRKPGLARTTSPGPETVPALRTVFDAMLALTEAAERDGGRPCRRR